MSTAWGLSTAFAVRILPPPPPPAVTVLNVSSPRFSGSLLKARQLHIVTSLLFAKNRDLRCGLPSQHLGATHVSNPGSIIKRFYPILFDCVLQALAAADATVRASASARVHVILGANTHYALTQHLVVRCPPPPACLATPVAGVTGPH